MDSSNVTAPPTDSSTTSPPPPDATPPPSSDSSPPPPSSSPPPSSPPPSSPPPSSSPPPAPSSPPPASSSPPPTQQDSSPTPQQSTSPPPATASPPPSTPSSSSTSPLQQQSSTPPPSSNGSPSWSPPPPSSNADDNNNNNSNSNNNSSNNNNTPSLSPPPSQSSSSSSSRNPSHSGALSPPPPPGHKSSSHMPSQTSSSSSSDDNSLSSSFNASNYKIPIIVGVTAGVVLLLIVMTLIIVSCCKKKKKKQRPHDQMKYYNDNSTNNQMKGYYADPSPVHKATSTDFYSSSGQQSNNWHNNMPSMNQVGTVPPPPQGALAPPPGGRWAPPPPPPPMMSSSEMSSNYSSGPKHPPLPPPSPSITLGFSKSSFSYDELAAATNGFSQANLLGQGGFGYVHRGVLANGEVVAVKSLKSGSCQGEREFQAEVEIISRVHHRHLVSLVGYCIAGGQRMLVYEFVSNKTLEYHLHGKDRPTMEWASRLRIALGSAKGLAYLHEDCHPRIIHRDIKAANILLDNNFEAMVADFGLAKLSSDNYTHVSTRVMGTFGYLAPEYASSGKLTEKSDVFSFGVMLLELITGRRPVDTTNSYMEDSLVDWARPLLTRALGDGNYEGLADPRLGDNYEPQEMARMVFCASASIRHSAKRRPKMKQIVHALEGDVSLEDLNEGVRAGQSSPFYSSESSDYDTSSYNADMKRFRKMALTTSQEMGSSEYGATSEYGLNPSSSSSGDSREMSRTHMH